MSRNEKTSFALLGLLSIEPMSGYDMRMHLKESMAYFWSESFGQIYPTLKRLAADRLIQASGKSASAREKQLYKLTAKGRAHLRQWLGRPPEPQPARDEFLLKLFLGSSAPAGAIAEHVRVYQAEQEKTLAIYGIMHDHVQRERRAYSDQKYWLLILERGIALKQSEIEWCNDALRMLGRRKATLVALPARRPIAGHGP